MASKATSTKWRESAKVPAHLQIKPLPRTGGLTLDDITPGAQGVVIRIVAPAREAVVANRPHRDPVRLAYGRRDARWYVEDGVATYDESYDDDGLEWRSK